jgi:hypothetical protein
MSAKAPTVRETIEEGTTLGNMHKKSEGKRLGNIYTREIPREYLQYFVFDVKVYMF